jgi:hypothetical protein
VTLNGTKVSGWVVVRATTSAACMFMVDQRDDWQAPLAACRSLRAGS